MSEAGGPGALWSAKAQDWADLQEPLHRPKYEDAIQRIAIGPGNAVLDLGCGAGTFCRIAAETGATVAGIDAAEGLVQIARRIVPEGRFDLGDVTQLPYEDGTFDRVTSFNSLQFVADPRRVLAEVRRVSKRECQLYLLVWGRPEHNDLMVVMKALHPLLPPRPAGSAGPLALTPPGVLEDLVASCGLSVAEAGYLAVPYEYPDQATMLRAQSSSAPAVLAARTVGDAQLADAITTALAPYRQTSGGYRLNTEYRYLTARLAE